MSADHLGDLDTSNTMLDGLDVARFLSRAWFDPSHHEADLRDAAANVFVSRSRRAVCRAPDASHASTARPRSYRRVEVHRAARLDEKFTSLEIETGFASAPISSRARRAEPFPAVPRATERLAPGSVQITEPHSCVQQHLTTPLCRARARQHSPRPRRLRAERPLPRRQVVCDRRHRRSPHRLPV